MNEATTTKIAATDANFIYVTYTRRDAKGGITLNGTDWEVKKDSPVGTMLSHSYPSVTLTDRKGCTETWAI